MKKNYSLSFELNSLHIVHPIKNNEEIQNIIEIKSASDSLKIRIQAGKQLKMVRIIIKLNLYIKMRKKKDKYSEVGGFLLEKTPNIILLITITKENLVIFEKLFFYKKD